MAALKFVSRRMFVILLGREYLGLNSLFTDVLSMLSLAELGFSVSITYSLYRPVARGETELVKSLVRLYRKVYRAVGCVVFAVGLLLTPFLGFFVKEMPENIPHIPLIYVLNLTNASISYFFAYKSTVLFVHQKKYIETVIRAGVSLAAAAAEIAVLLLTRNYLYYLLLTIGATIAQNAAISDKADRLYPYLREKDVRPLPTAVLSEIRRNVKAMFLHRVGTVVVFNMDYLLISKFAGVAVTGLYSNYMMIRGFLNTLINALFDAVTPTLGNLTVTEAEECRRTAFYRLNFLAAWLLGWMSICLFCLYDPFIDIWLGKGYLLSKPTVLLIVLNFYCNSMRIPVNNTKGVLGLFWDDRYKSIAEAACNLVFSVILARRWGVEGIMAGTLISTIALPFWYEPRILYRKGLHISVRKYFKGYIMHLSVTVIVGAMTWFLCRAIGGGAACFLLKCVICVLIPNVIYLIVYWKTDELSFFKDAAIKRAA